MTTRILCIVLLIFCLTQFGWTAEQSTQQVTNPSESKVSIKASDSKISTVIESLQKQSKDKIIAESTVTGTATLAVESVPLETALSSLCKANNLQWRCIYMSEESSLLKQPDKLASTVRLLSGMNFPDMVISGASTGVTSIYTKANDTVKSSKDKMISDLKLTRVYLITNDAAISKKESKDSAVDQYIAAQQKSMEDFAKMTPEQQEQVVMDSVQLSEQMDPAYMNSIMQALTRTNPDIFKRMVTRQTELMFNMDPAQRRAMIRMNMEAVKSLTPEQLQMLQEDTKAVMDEISKENGQ